MTCTEAKQYFDRRRQISYSNVTLDCLSSGIYKLYAKKILLSSETLLKNPLIQLSSVQARESGCMPSAWTPPNPSAPARRPRRQRWRHLGYLQIDTIYVIERSHHHVLHTRIPTYRREHLHQAQSIDKTVFEYWTHAYRTCRRRACGFMCAICARPPGLAACNGWFGKVSDDDLRRVLSRIRRQGALTIRDIEDEPVEKDYAWASRKPSKRVLELAFLQGLVKNSQRVGMLEDL